MTDVTVFGAAYSVYVRIVRLALEEKGVPYRLEEVDIFADGGPPTEHVARHPFAKIPAFAHGDFQLYETGAITRYVDAAFEGPRLVPEDLPARARMDQIIGLLDSYGYRAMVWDVFVERVQRTAQGGEPDEERISSGLTTAGRCLNALSDLKGAHAFLAADHVSLADLHVAPMLVYFSMAPEGAALLGQASDLSDWWSRLSARPSLAATRFPREETST